MKANIRSSIPIAVFAASALIACGLNRPLPSGGDPEPAALDQSFQRPLPIIFERRLEKLTSADPILAAHPSTSQVALVDEQLWLGHGAEASSLFPLSMPGGQWQTRQAPLSISGASFAFVLADGNLWYGKNTSLFRTTADAATLASSGLESLPAKELALHPDIQNITHILGISANDMIIEANGSLYAHVHFDAQAGQITARKISMVPQFTALSETMLGAGVLRDNNGYWFMKGDYLAVLKATTANDNQGDSANYVWQLYDNKLRWPETATVKAVAMDIGQGDGAPNLKGEVYYLTDKGLYATVPVEKLTLTWDADIKDLATRFCADCHFNQDHGPFTKEQWLASKDAIIKSLASDAPAELRMPRLPNGQFHDDARRSFIHWLSSDHPQ